MFELPEFQTLAKQINQTLTGKIIRKGSLGNSPHKFVWYNRTHEEFERLTRKKVFGVANTRGRWLFIPLIPGYLLVFGECGGRLLYHAPGAAVPDKYHLLIEMTDGSHLSAMTQMWGAMELYETGKEQERQYIKGMRPTPMDPGFTFEYFSDLIDSLLLGEKRSVKALLTQDQLVPGLGNSIAQDIMFGAYLHPKCPIGSLDRDQRHRLYDAILNTLHEAIERGGRNDEVDLFGQKGGYVRVMDSHAVGQPCPECGTTVEKIQYLGGACYICPSCNQLCA